MHQRPNEIQERCVHLQQDLKVVHFARPVSDLELSWQDVHIVISTELRLGLMRGHNAF